MNPRDRAWRGGAILSTCILPILLAVGARGHDAHGSDLAFHAISMGGKSFADAVSTSYIIHLRYAEFDPLAQVPQVPAAFRSGPDTKLYIVQFWSPPVEEYRQAIRDLGGVVHKYLPNHCHVAELDPPEVLKVEQLDFVRWVGPFHPAYRVELPLPTFPDGSETGPPRKYTAFLLDTGPEAREDVARRIEFIGGTFDGVTGNRLVELTLDLTQLLQAARFDEIAFIERWTPYESTMNRVRQATGADALEAAAGFTGTGVRGEVFDHFFNPDHCDFQSRPLVPHTSPGTPGTHGASTSGILFGDGACQPLARGLLPAGQGIIANIGFVTDRYAHTAELLGAPYEAVFQSASVGSGSGLVYSAASAEIDQILFDLDIAICQAQGNSGMQSSVAEAWAKNVIAVGGVNHFNTTSLADDSWNGDASFGPAADGRVKPDLCHFNDNILTVAGGKPMAYTSSFFGTSAATPIVAGHLGLFFEMWSQGVFGNPVSGGTVFENRCHMTTAKAMLINTATQYDWTLGGPNGDIDRFKQGWGLPHVMTLYDLRNSIFIVDETDLLEVQQALTYPLTLDADPETPLKATLVYADPPALPNATVHRINDLTLQVISPGGTTYWGNHGLDAGVWSQPGGQRNAVDTVENVFIEDPQAGTWQVKVLSFEINEDGHVETPAIDADFALVVSGVTVPGAASLIERPSTDLDGDGRVGARDLALLLSCWGSAEHCADLDDNGFVTIDDLTIMLANWTE